MDQRLCKKCPYTHDPKKCTGHKSKRDGEGNLVPCGNFPVHGAVVCTRHGAAAGQVKAKAAKNVVEARARGDFGRLVELCGTRIEGRTVEQALTDVIERTGAMVLAWFEIVCALQESASWEFEPVKGPQGSLQRWVTVSIEGLLGPNAQGEQKVNVANDEYRKWLGAYLHANKVAADLGLEERKIRVEERQTDLVEAALAGYLESKGIELDRKEFARHLRLVEGGAA